jgi:hypothetical protein
VSAVPNAVRRRLPPETFQLPVEKMRAGYYSDAYFTFSREVLERDGHHPRVLMQVFQREHSVLGGVDEALAILRECSGREGDGRWQSGWDQLTVRALYDGELVRPPGDRVPGGPGASHADQPQRPGRGAGGRRQADPVLPGALRPLARADR